MYKFYRLKSTGVPLKTPDVFKELYIAAVRLILEYPSCSENSSLYVHYKELLTALKLPATHDDYLLVTGRLFKDKTHITQIDLIAALETNILVYESKIQDRIIELENAKTKIETEHAAKVSDFNYMLNFDSIKKDYLDYELQLNLLRKGETQIISYNKYDEPSIRMLIEDISLIRL